MEAKSDCRGVLSEHPLEYTMLHDGDYNWSCSCGESGHPADYREHWVQIVITGVKGTSRPNGAEVTLTGATGTNKKSLISARHLIPAHEIIRNLLTSDSLSPSLVLAHGGRISVEPSSTGSKFVFLLPMDAYRGQQNYELGI